jgi:hypothetical protein
LKTVFWTQGVKRTMKPPWAHVSAKGRISWGADHKWLLIHSLIVEIIVEHVYFSLVGSEDRGGFATPGLPGVQLKIG